ncbi:MAG: hypothetical protein R2792_19965, partial [Saprospiraceae bacterium]
MTLSRFRPMTSALLVIAACVLFPNIIHAQLFSTATANQLQLDSLENVRYQALADTNVTESLHIVKMANLLSELYGDTLDFKIPGTIDTLSAISTLIKGTPGPGFSWSGKILGSDGGYVSFIDFDSIWVGFIHSKYGYHELVHAKDSFNYLIKRKPINGSCGMPENVDSTGSGPNECEYGLEFNLYNECPGVVTVLLAITPKARVWIEGNNDNVPHFVSTAESIVNLALANSDIPNKEVRFLWIDKEIDDFSDNPPDIDADKDNLKNWLEADKDTAKADIAVLVTNQGYFQATGAVMEILPPADSAFALVEVNAANTKFSLAHELGHI